MPGDEGNEVKGGSIARQMMHEAGLDVDTSKIDEARRKEVDAARENGQDIPDPKPAPPAAPAPSNNLDNSDTSNNDEGDATVVPVVVPATETPEPPVTPDPPAAVEGESKVPEDIILKEINARMGTDYKSLDEVKKPEKKLTKEEREQEEEAEEKEAVAYAIKEGKIKPKDLSEYAVESAMSPRDIALKLFTEKALKDGVAAEKVEELFKEFFHEYDEEGSVVKTMRANDMENIAKNYLASKYSSVIGLKDKYREARDTQARQSNFTQMVDRVHDVLPREMSFDVEEAGPDGKPVTSKYQFKIDDSVLSAVKAEFHKPESFEAIGQRTLNDEHMKEAYNMAILKRVFSKAVSAVAKSHKDKALHEEIARRKNIPSDAHKRQPQQVQSGNRNSIVRQAMADAD